MKGYRTSFVARTERHFSIQSNASNFISSLGTIPVKLNS